MAEANTIQQLHELKGTFLTLADWAARHKLGHANVQMARGYSLEAEKKMGEMLAQTARSKGGDRAGRKKIGGSRTLPPNPPPTLDELKITKRESAEAQKLAALPEERFFALRQGETTRKEAFNPTHVGHNSGENEWYTPPALIEAARAVMGIIDCDPASSAIANRTVRAEVFFTRQQDGLVQEWNGNVWLNPPYEQPFMGQFAARLCGQYGEGRIRQACVLVNNATETAWFQQLLGAAAAVCFPRSRIKFLNVRGEACGAPLQGQAVIYLGGKVRAFSERFGEFGIVLCKIT